MPNITQSIKDNISITEYAERLGYHVRQVSAGRWTLDEHDSININWIPSILAGKGSSGTARAQREV